VLLVSLVCLVDQVYYITSVVLMCIFFSTNKWMADDGLL